MGRAGRVMLLAKNPVILDAGAEGERAALVRLVERALKIEPDHSGVALLEFDDFLLCHFLSRFS